MEKINKKQKKNINKKNKGQFVGDANANRDFIKIAVDAGWEEIHIPANDFQKKYSDANVLTKYTKGTHPIFTADTTAHKLTVKERGRSGYILHKVPVKGEQSVQYEEQIKKFFTNYRESQTHKIRWTIEFDREPSKEQLEEK